MVISNTPSLLFSVISNPTHSSCEGFLCLSGRDPIAGLGLHGEVHVLTRHKAAIRAVCKRAAFPKAEGKQQDPMAAVVLGPACAEEGNPQETPGIRGS